MRNPNGYGSIIKLSGTRRRPYAVRVTAGWSLDGRQIFKYLSYHESKADALIAMAEYNKSPYDMDANRITFAELYERYSAGEFSPALEKLNKTSFNHCKALHGKLFKDLRKAHFQGVISSLATPTAKTNVASFFRKLSAYAMENDLITKDYSSFVEVPTKKRKSDKMPFTVEEVSQLWGLVGNINAEIMLILCYSGMRVSELLTLRKDQIHGDHIITGSKTEAGRDRYIPIHSRIAPLIEKHLQNPSQWLIVNNRGDKPIRYDSFHAKRWKKLKKAQSFRDVLTIHSTRHFFISELHRLGANKLAVQKIVGHKGEDVTDQVYTHFTTEELHKTVNLLQ